MASVQEELQQARRELDELRREFDAMSKRIRNMQVADESGGGQVIIGEDKIVIRLNALTNTSVQLSS